MWSRTLQSPPTSHTDHPRCRKTLQSVESSLLGCLKKGWEARPQATEGGKEVGRPLPVRGVPKSPRIASPRGPPEERSAPCRPPMERGSGPGSGSLEAGKMAGRPATGASPSADRDGAAPNVVARVSQWADDHLRLVRVSQPSQPGRWWADRGQRAWRPQPQARVGEAARGGRGGRGGRRSQVLPALCWVPGLPGERAPAGAVAEGRARRPCRPGERRGFFVLFLFLSEVRSHWSSIKGGTFEATRLERIVAKTPLVGAAWRVCVWGAKKWRNQSSFPLVGRCWQKLLMCSSCG